MNISDLLDDDAWMEVARSLGIHPCGIIARTRLSMTCIRLRGIHLLGCNGKGGGLYIGFRDLFLTLKQCDKITPTYDISTGRVHMIVDLALGEGVFPYDGPGCGAKWYMPENRVIWPCRKSAGLLLSIENFSVAEHHTVLVDSIENYRIPEKIQTDMIRLRESPLRRRERRDSRSARSNNKGVGNHKGVGSLQTLLRNIFAHAFEFTSMIVDGNVDGSPALREKDRNGELKLVSIPIATPLLLSLRDLQLFGIPLDVTSLCHIAAATHLVHLDLTDSIVYESAVVSQALGTLVRKWQDSHLTQLRELVIDKSYLTREQLLYIVQQIDGWDAFGTDADVTGVIDGCFWNDFVFLATPTFQGTHKFTRDAAAAAPPVAPTALAPPVVAPSVAPVAAPVTTNHANHANHANPVIYKAPTRERDRYMMLWYDYTCPGCGVVWTKHSVTVSFKETASSECMRRKRTCATRPECQRMMAGETFINRNQRLTPPADEVLRLDLDGLLVGINPVTHAREYFRPDPTIPNRKVQV